MIILITLYERKEKTMMSNQNRELTSKEKRSIKRLIKRLCANYDSEYGCLPLDCDCPISASATQTVLCAATFGDLFCQMTRSCKRHWKASLSAPVSIAARNFWLMESGCTVPNSVRNLPAVSRMQREYGNSGTSESNHLPLRNPDSTRVFGGHFAFGKEFYQNHENSEEKRYTAGMQS